MLDALKDFLSEQIDATLQAAVDSPAVVVLGSRDLATTPAGNELGLYLHRVSVDPFGRNRPLPSRRPSDPPQSELPVNLHLLLVGWSAHRTAEQVMLAWGMQALGAATQLTAAHLSSYDPDWGDQDCVQVIPDDMTTEDLMRIWDGMPQDYILSTPYIIKTLRLRPLRDREGGPEATSIVIPTGSL